jgi:hypothetical protein
MVAQSLKHERALRHGSFADMDDPFSQLPKAAVLVYAGVLAAAASNTALAGQTEAELAAGVSTQEVPQQAPTCGPACHDGNYQEQIVAPPEPDPVAPTCGPACHDSSYQEQEAPPPLPPNERKGCAVGPALGPEANLALLGLGLSFGVGLSIAGRRRNRSSES